MDDSKKKLARLKAEQRAITAWDKQLHNLIDSNNSNFEDKVAIFKTLVHADQMRFKMALSKMLDDSERDD